MNKANLLKLECDLLLSEESSIIYVDRGKWTGTNYNLLPLSDLLRSALVTTDDSMECDYDRISKLTITIEQRQ